MNFFHDISKFCIVALIAVVVVGCSSEVTCPEPDRPQPKPVQPIKPRPIVPDGQIQRPRIVEIDFSTIERLPSFGDALPYDVKLCTAQGEVVAEGQIVLHDEPINVEVESPERLYLYVNDECVAEYDAQE